MVICSCPSVSRRSGAPLLFQHDVFSKNNTIDEVWIDFLQGRLGMSLDTHGIYYIMSLAHSMAEAQ